MLADDDVLFKEMAKTLRNDSGLQLSLDGSCLLQFNETGQATWALLDQEALASLISKTSLKDDDEEDEPPPPPPPPKSKPLP